MVQAGESDHAALHLLYNSVPYPILFLVGFTRLELKERDLGGVCLLGSSSMKFAIRI